MSTFTKLTEMTLDDRKLIDVEISPDGYFSNAVWEDNMEDLTNEDLERLDWRYPDELWLAIQDGLEMRAAK